MLAVLRIFTTEGDMDPAGISFALHYQLIKTGVVEKPKIAVDER